MEWDAWAGKVRDAGTHWPELRKREPFHPLSTGWGHYLDGTLTKVICAAIEQERNLRSLNRLKTKRTSSHRVNLRICNLLRALQNCLSTRDIVQGEREKKQNSACRPTDCRPFAKVYPSKLLLSLCKWKQIQCRLTNNTA